MGVSWSGKYSHIRLETKDTISANTHKTEQKDSKVIEDKYYYLNVDGSEDDEVSDPSEEQDPEIDLYYHFFLVFNFFSLIGTFVINIWNIVYHAVHWYNFEYEQEYEDEKREKGELSELYNPYDATEESIQVQEGDSEALVNDDPLEDRDGANTPNSEV